MQNCRKATRIQVIVFAALAAILIVVGTLRFRFELIENVGVAMFCARPDINRYDPLLFSAELEFSWKRVEEDSLNTTLVFSSFYDERTKEVRVHGVTPTDQFASVHYCLLWFRNGQEWISEWATTRFDFSPENHGFRYHPSFYTCKSKTDRIPIAVSLATKRCQQPTNNFIRVLSPLDDVINVFSNNRTPDVVNFTVCVGPMHSQFNDYHQLVEMIEVNQIFGAQRFVFYNYSTGRDVSAVLRRYESEGLVRVIPWHIPLNVSSYDLPPAERLVEPDIHYFGQVAALNDCLYRNMFTSRFIVFTDIDELLVPRRHGTWNQLLDYVTSSMLVKGLKHTQLAQPSNPSPTTSVPGAYSVRSTFFRALWENDSMTFRDEPSVEKYKIWTLLTTTREEYIYPWYERTKYIVSARTPFVLGVHTVLKFLDPWISSMNVQDDLALVHHLRQDEGRQHTPRKTDRRMHAFQKDIVARIVNRHEQLAELMHSRS